MNIKFIKGINAFFNRFRRNEDGATAIEYGLIVALIAVTLILALIQFSTAMDGMFVRMDNSVDAVLTKAEGGP